MDAREQFLKNLAILADMCEYTFSKELVALYDQAFQEFSYEVGARAVEKIILTRKGKDRFPSIQDIKDIVQPHLAPQHEAELISNRILVAVRRHGHTWVNFEGWRDEAVKELSETGMRVVDLFGGWTMICHSEGNATIMRAQLKRLAEAVIEENKVKAAEQLVLNISQRTAGGEIATSKPVLVGSLNPEDL